MIIFLYGKDTFRSKQHAKRMIEKFTADRDPQRLNTHVLDAQSKKTGEILEQIKAAPFLAERRMVVVENLLISKNKELQEQFLGYIEERTLPDSTVVVLWEETDSFKTKAATTLFERLTKEKFVQCFDQLSGAKLEAWVATEATERGGSFEPAARSWLVANTDSDMWWLDSVLDQLIFYCKGRSVTVADVKKFVEQKTDDSIFTLVDAIVSKRPQSVFVMLQEQYRQGKDALYVFAMLLRQFRILLQMRDVFERDGNVLSDTLAKQLKLHPFVVKKTLPLVKKYTVSELSQIYDALLDMDINIKTGQADQQLLLDILIGKISTNQ